MNSKILSLAIIFLMLVGSFTAVGLVTRKNSVEIVNSHGLGILSGEGITLPVTTFYGAAPDDFDWRNYNGKDYTTPIRDQGNCASCYAFASIAAVESIIKKEHYNNPRWDDYDDLSEQFIVSCGEKCDTKNFLGCDGGYTSDTLDFLQEKGIITEDYFEYQARDGGPGLDQVLCHHKKPDWSRSLIRITNCGSVSSSTDQIKNALIQNGPLPTRMIVYEDFYNDYPDKSIWPKDVYFYDHGNIVGGSGRHAITIVGYQKDSSVKNGGYWICKNSWGEEWGIKNPHDHNNNGGWFKIAWGDSRSEINKNVYFLNGIYNPSGISEIRGVGDIVWDQGTPGEPLTDSFSIYNDGEMNSVVDEWSIQKYSPWGWKWTFTPSRSNGNSLVRHEQIYIAVSVVPEMKQGGDQGYIKIETDECYDCDIIGAKVRKDKPISNDRFDLNNRLFDLLNRYFPNLGIIF